MRYCRFQWNGHSCYGRVELRTGEAWIVELIEAPEEDLAYRVEHGSSRAPEGFRATPLAAAELLAPVTPSKIVCIGRNYRDHVKEILNSMPDDAPLSPVLFLKPPSSLLAPRGVIVRPRVAQRVDYEGELAVVIGKRARKIEAEQWRQYVRGYTVANDVTARDLQYSDGQWARAKGFDSFCPVGPVITDEIDPEQARIETRVNGELRQNESATRLIFPIPLLIAFITDVMTLEPGDLVLTGTPAGIGMLDRDDRVVVSIEGVGALENTVL